MRRQPDLIGREVSAGPKGAAEARPLSRCKRTNCDHEDDGTAEPSLGALNRVCQLHWAVGSRSDREEDAGDMAEVPANGD